MRRDRLGQVPRQPDAARDSRPVDRALSVLEVIADSGDVLGVSEIGRRTGLPKSTASRILNDLLGLGLVTRVQRAYTVGPRTLALAERLDPIGVAARRGLLEPRLERLLDATGLAAAFSTLRYRRVRFESVQFGAIRAEALARLPLWAPMHCTSSGKVLLAYARSRERLLHDIRKTAFTRSTITSAESLREELARIRRDGSAFSDGEYVDGVSSVAVPVFGVSGFVGALAVCGSPAEVAGKPVRAALRRAAWELTAALWRPPDD